MKSIFPLAGAALLFCAGPLQAAEGKVGQVQQVAPGVYFHEGDLKASGHCNHGWIVFEDFVLVVDGNFPSGALEVLPKIKATTDKPIRFVVDTHHHGDHAYGNQVWLENGVTPVAHQGALDEMKKYETGHFGGKPGRWEFAAKAREDMRKSKLRPPIVLFETKLVFDDGKRRVELLHLGTAHTQGDTFVWLPREKILFTGDACVNGPYNYVGDGNSLKWVQTLEAAKKLGATRVCPGHGPHASGALLDDQMAYFRELQAQVRELAKTVKTPEAARERAKDVGMAIRKKEPIARYVGDFIEAQVEKAFTELTGVAPKDKEEK